MTNIRKGASLPANGDVQKGIIDFLRQALKQGAVDAVLIPRRVPAGDSFTYFLIRDEALLKGASPLAPNMPVQGARVISSITRRGKGKTRIAAIMRPCEARATIELAKLSQVDLEYVTIITVDCPGVIPLSDYSEGAAKGDKLFQDASQNWNSEPMRPVCRICDKFSASGGQDIHIGTLGTKNGSILLIANSSKGEDTLNRLGISPEEDISGWEARVNKLIDERRKQRKQNNDALRADIEGIDRLAEAFSTCINCHNCMRVCPICYCRQCHFDSDNMKFSFDDYLARAEARGGLRIPTDTLLFHIGRMLHMSLSCVSCGMCEDACPMAIPVAQIFTLVGDRNQEAFDYVPGRSVDEPLPLRTFEEDEFQEVEQSYVAVSARQESHHE
jgi:formate dehydrogenase subunit beta